MAVTGHTLVRPADGFSIDLAHAPVQYLSLPDKLAACFGYDLDGRRRVDAMLVEYAERLHAEIAQGVLAYAPDVCRGAVLFGLHLHAVHELVPEFGRDEHAVGIAFQGFAYQFFILVVAIAFSRIE